MTVEIRRGASRFTEREAGRLSHHSFSFGTHYDPERVSFGPMVCHDDHLLGRGNGFAEHPHESLEIITFVVSGSLVHTSGTDAPVTLPAGSCGVLSAGDGVRHSEVASADGPARFVQVWLTPDDPSGAPTHATSSVLAAPGDGLVRVVGDGGALTVGVAGAAFEVARLDAGETLTLPAADRVHAFVASGALLRFSLAEPLSAGDVACWTNGASYDVTAAVPTQLLVWSFS